MCWNILNPKFHDLMSSVVEDNVDRVSSFVMAMLVEQCMWNASRSITNEFFSKKICGSF